MAGQYGQYPSSSGSGVSSVALADGSTTAIYNITGSPVTGTGTLTFTFKTQSANTVLAGPTTGAASQPTFRSLVAADITALFGNLTTSSANFAVGNGTGAVFGSGTTLTITEGNLTESTSAVLTITGGTNSVLGSGTTIQVKQAATAQNGYLSSTDWNTFNGKQPTGNYATSGSGDVSWSAPSGAGPVTTALVATTNSTLTSLPTLTSIGTSVTANTFLASPNGSAGSITSRSIVAADVPTLNQNTTGTASNITATTNSTLTTISTLTSVGTIATGTWNATTIAVGKGGTGVTSVTVAPAATAFAGWDANKNMSANAFIEGFTSTATAAGTTTMLITNSTYANLWTGSSTQTIKLPTTSIVAGASYQIINTSTGALAIQSSAGTAILSMASNTICTFTALVATPTTPANWAYTYQPIFQPSTPTNAYYSGSMSNAGSWSTTSATYVDPTNTGGNTLTQRKASGITVTAGASSVPGISFTPPATTAVYRIRCSFPGGGTTNGAGANFQLFDGTTVITTASSQPGASGDMPQVTLDGIYAPASTSAQTVKIQVATQGGGTAQIKAITSDLNPVIEWSMFQIA